MYQTQPLPRASIVLQQSTKVSPALPCPALPCLAQRTPALFGQPLLCYFELALALPCQVMLYSALACPRSAPALLCLVCKSFAKLDSEQLLIMLALVILQGAATVELHVRRALSATRKCTIDAS